MPDPVLTAPEVRPPHWLAVSAVVVVSCFAALCVVAPLAAMAGLFKPAILLPISAVLGGLLTAATLPAVPAWSSPRSVHLVAVAVIGFAAATAGYNALNHGQHLATDRDPGVYLTTARHLMEEGNLLLPGPSGPFFEADRLNAASAGFTPADKPGEVEAQFPHLNASLLAVGGWLSEVGLFLVPPMLGGLALLCLYLWASSLAGAGWAAVAVVITGTCMPVMVFSRDTYSEPLASALIFGGLWILHVAHRSAQVGPWLLAGLLLGATSMARVDGYLYLTPVMIALVLVVRLAEPAGRQLARRNAGVCAAAVVVVSGIGLVDTVTLTGSYYASDLAPRLPAMLLAAVAAIGLTWVAAPSLWQRQTISGSVQSTRLLRGLVAGSIVVLSSFFAWAFWLRPDFSGLPEQAAEGVNLLSFLDQASTLTMRWLSWYLGPVGLGASVVGLLLMVHSLGRRRTLDPSALAGVGAVATVLVLYVWAPNITPDQPWAMRRFAPVVLPGLAVGVSFLCCRLWRIGREHLASRVDRRSPAQRLVGWSVLAVAPMVAVACVVSSVVITWPVRSARAQTGMREKMHQICAELEDTDVVLVTMEGLLSLMMSVPVGVWCDVPSAGGGVHMGAQDVAALAIEWETQGRRLVVLSSSVTPSGGMLEAAGLIRSSTSLDPFFPTEVEPAVTSRPDEIVVDGRLGRDPGGAARFYLYRIDVERARRYLEGVDEG